MPFYIIKIMALLLILLCICGCAPAKHSVAPAEKLVAAPFEAAANAEFSELSAKVMISCASPDNIKMEFTYPETIAGLELSLSGDELKTSFAKTQHIQKLSETDRKNPAKAFMSLMNGVRRECASAEGAQVEKTSEGVKLICESGSIEFFEDAPREMMLFDAALRLVITEFSYSAPSDD